MDSTEHSFSISIRYLGRMFDDEWEKIDPEHIDFWSNEAVLLSERSFTHDGCSVTVMTDWRPIARRYKQDFQMLQLVHQGRESEDDYIRKFARPVRFRGSVHIEGKNKTYPGFYLEIFLYEMFAIANLALPGVADFYSLSFQGENERQPLKLKYPVDTLKLSAHIFDSCWVESLQGNWPTLRRIPLRKVICWFNALDIGVKQKADSGIERAIFALYHLCKLEGGLESVIWIFHGLEAFFDTRVGVNISGLNRRISMLLDLDAKKKIYFRKKLQELYNLRSSFVHGNYSILHPLQNEIVDHRLEADYTKLSFLEQFGFSVLVASLQAMIDTDLLELTYEEKLVGKRLSP